MEISLSALPKTQYSFSTDPKIYGAVDNFEFHVQDIVMNAGAEMLGSHCRRNNAYAGIAEGTAGIAY